MRDRAYVPIMPPAALVTADELLHMSFPDKRVELVRGILVVREPPGYRHGELAARITKILIDYADAEGAGRVLVGDPGFKLAANPDTVRGPDVAFVRRERLPTPSPLGFADFPPDLAVEILSPGDRPGEVLAKVGDWLNAGTRLVWVIDPARRGAPSQVSSSPPVPERRRGQGVRTRRPSRLDSRAFAAIAPTARK
jgi:Uma2 family endonuclease